MTSHPMHEKALQYYKNISDSAAFVFTSLVQSEPRQKKVFNRRLSSLPNDIIIRFNFEADISGYFAFFFSLKNALAICTISDHLSKNESLDAQARQSSFTQMMEIALDIA